MVADGVGATAAAREGKALDVARWVATALVAAAVAVLTFCKVVRCTGAASVCTRPSRLRRRLTKLGAGAAQPSLAVDAVPVVVAVVVMVAVVVAMVVAVTGARRNSCAR